MSSWRARALINRAIDVRAHPASPSRARDAERVKISSGRPPPLASRPAFDWQSSAISSIRYDPRIAMSPTDHPALVRRTSQGDVPGHLGRRRRLRRRRVRPPFRCQDAEVGRLAQADPQRRIQAGVEDGVPFRCWIGQHDRVGVDNVTDRCRLSRPEAAQARRPRRPKPASRANPSRPRLGQRPADPPAARRGLIARVPVLLQRSGKQPGPGPQEPPGCTLAPARGQHENRSWIAPRFALEGGRPAAIWVQHRLRKRDRSAVRRSLRTCSVTCNWFRPR